MPKPKKNERVCSTKPRWCHASGAPQPISEFRFFEISKRWSRMCRRCRAKNARMQERWRCRNPEVAAEQARTSSRRWTKENPKLHREYERDYYWRNAEKRRARARAYYHKNKKDPVWYRRFREAQNRSRRIRLAREKLAKGKK